MKNTCKNRSITIKPEGNLFADKGSSVLAWLLISGIQKPQFSIREVARETGVSVGRVHQIFSGLILHGILETHGLQTKKRFSLTRPKTLIENWLKKYDITRKCQMWTYSTSLTKQQCYRLIDQKKLPITFALHSSAEKHGYKSTNVNLMEFYLLDPKQRQYIENQYQLEPKEHGYNVLLIEPYYKKLLHMHQEVHLLLTFLDLYHFPLRGIEQAEYMAERAPLLKKIYRSKV